MTARLCLVAACLLGLALVACRNRDDDDANQPSPTPLASAGDPAETTPTESGSPGTVTAAAPSGAPGVHAGVVEIDGDERTWRLYVPDSLPAGPVPLVIGLHGGFGSGEQFARTTRFDDAADEHGFIIAYPNGTGVIPTWNAGRCCGAAARDNVDDEAFIDAMIAEIVAEYPIDQARIYAAGHSNGGMLALRFACQLAHRFAGVAAVGASLEVPIEGCFPARPVSVLLIHGTADENHPLEGGQGTNSFSNVNYTSVAVSMEGLRTVMGCPGATEILTGYGPVTTTRWSGCENGVLVEQQIIDGASHAWPGGRPGLGLGGEPTDALDATEEIWKFFQRTMPVTG